MTNTEILQNLLTQRAGGMLENELFLAQANTLLLDPAIDLTITDRLEGMPLLHHLILANNNRGDCDEMIEALLKRNSALLSLRDNNGYTPLQMLLAAYTYRRAYSMERFKQHALLFAEHGANLQEKFTTKTVLHILLETNVGQIHDSAIMRLCARDLGLASVPNGRGQTPIQALIEQYEGNITRTFRDAFKDNVHLLFLCGADLTEKMENTALHHLVCNDTDGGNYAVIRALLQAKPGLASVQNNRGQTPLQMLLANRSYFDNQNDIRNMAIFLSSLDVDMAEISYFDLLAGQDLNSIRLEEIQLLEKHHSLCDAEGNNFLRFVLRHHPDISVEDFEGILGLDFDWQASNTLGETLLHQACQVQNAPLAQHLVAKGLDVQKITAARRTALHCAVQPVTASNKKHLEFWNWLRDQGVDLNAQDNAGQTALHLTVANKHYDLMWWLIEQGVDVNLTNDADETPLDIAESGPNEDLLCSTFLRQHGANNSTNPKLIAANRLETLRKKTALLTAITNMHTYGMTLRQNGIAKGDVAIALAGQLQAKVLSAFTENGELKTEVDGHGFHRLLHSQDTAMAAYRLNWDTLILNIAIALTGLGLVAIVGHLIVTACQNRPLFFFQKPQTTCAQHVAAIEEASDEMPIAFLR
jgi:ankyrin repeat protein